VAQALGKKLKGVRLDTPASRRGNLKRILKEVRWELDLRGFKQVKIFVSGGLNEGSIRDLVEITDGFGVGTSISNAPVIDLSLDIIEIEGKPFAKRGKSSGRKKLIRCAKCKKRSIVPEIGGTKSNCRCAAKKENLLVPVLKKGKRVKKEIRPQEIRKFALKELHAEKTFICL